MNKISYPAFLFFLLFFPLLAWSEVPTWQIVPNQSSIKFTATQNGAPVSGEFKKFTGEIHYDPNQLKESSANIVVEMASVSDVYNQLSDTLKDKDWFDIKMFPTAVFKANEFVKTGDKTYQAKGSLTIRDKTLPITLNFTQEEYGAEKALVKGNASIKRTAFGVGQGDWTDTSAVKDDVKIDFVISAVKK